MYTIKFKFACRELQPVVLYQIEPGQSLLELALKHGIVLNHKCGGICSCTTCHIYIEHGTENLEPKSNREADYLGRVINSRKNSRLACQSLLKDISKGIVEVTVPDQS
ncbi:MAG: 2Fe-2S iron-sulfur cluster-binding protein [Chitinophagaceae bacterium]